MKASFWILLEIIVLGVLIVQSMVSYMCLLLPYLLIVTFIYQALENTLFGVSPSFLHWMMSFGGD